MASDDLKNELNCSICLNLYTDPVSLRCGHNFCRSCIVQVLDTQDGSGGYSCPDCRAEYPERPPLEKRRKLDDTEEHFTSTHSDIDKTKFFCTYCTKSPVTAVKSCLQCEICLCDDHLTAHNKTSDHILAEPTGSFDNKKCPIHKKVLEYYCPEDSSCLCVTCCLVGEHRGHQVELLDEAFKEKKKQLKGDLDELNSQKAEILTKVQNLHEEKRIIQMKSSNKRKNINKLFMDIKEQLKMAEKETLSEISDQEKEIVSDISYSIRNLKLEEDELSRKMQHLKKMSHVTDPIRFLQERDNPCGHGDSEDTAKDGGKRTFEVALVSVINIKVIKTDQIEESDLETSSCENSMETEEESSVSYLPWKSNDLNEVLISLTLHRSIWGITNVTSKLGFHVPDILLDVDTADLFLELSEDLKTATYVERKQNRSKSLGRFLDCRQVLSICGLSSGRHYWEVQCNPIERCSIGMSYASIKRVGSESVIGQNDKSWGLSLDKQDYSLSHNWQKDNLWMEVNDSSYSESTDSTNLTIGVFLDYEAGRLSFYEISNYIRYLDAITASFTEPLHAIFHISPGASLTIGS